MEARPLRMLSGEEIVEKRKNLSDCILPEVGIKEVSPNGSWLETKQIQTALEARKMLVAAERVDKVGALSHAEWSDLLKLAEVTKKVGGHWQYMGHNNNGTLYLLPEEALYLIETNCLLLKHNNVTVSLQKAYNLLLDHEITLTQYKVYASLSRVGYKVFRHATCQSQNTTNTSNENPDVVMKEDVPLHRDPKEACITVSTHTPNDYENTQANEDVVMNDSGIVAKDVPLHSEPKEACLTVSTVTTNGRGDTQAKDVTMNETGIVTKARFSIDEFGVIRAEGMCTDNTTLSDIRSATDVSTNEATPIKPGCKANNYLIMQRKILSRKIKPSDPKSIHDKFKDIPDFCQQQPVIVTVPDEEFLPRNIFLNNQTYEVNISKMKDSKLPKSTEKPRGIPSGNGSMYRLMRNSIVSERAAVPSPELPQFLPNADPFLQSFGYFHNWRPRFHQFQRPFIPQHRFNQHPYFYRVMHHMPRNFRPFRPRGPLSYYLGSAQKRPGNILRNNHLQGIKNLARQLKEVASPDIELKRTLEGLLDRFNEIYNEKLRITPEFDIVEDSAADPIEIDDDDDVQIASTAEQRPQLDSAKFDQYFDTVKEMAARLKNLARKNRTVSKQKRAFCNLLKHFNKTFDAELYLNDKGELIDKKLVVVDSSDSDVIATNDIEPRKSKKRSSKGDGGDTTQKKKRKVLPNPFSVLSGLNQRQSDEKSNDLSKYFDKNWLRDDDDFGKPEICSKVHAIRLLSNNSQQLYEFMDDPNTYKNWIDLKLQYYEHMQGMLTFEQNLKTHQYDNIPMDNSRLKPILQRGLSVDWACSLEKLRIIKTNTDVQESTSLKIDFDVYNRDVQNFRKTDPPKPHFRIVCVEESSKFPSGAEVRALHSKQDDNVTLVFAIVGAGSSTYLQINPVELPVYIEND